MSAGPIPQEVIRQVAEACDIVETIGSHVALKKTGATFTGLCPSHREKTPSFIVTPARGRYKCFGCGIAGDAFAFEMMVGNVGFSDAVRSLARRVGIMVDGDAESSVTPPRRALAPKPAPVVEPARKLTLPAGLHRGTRADVAAVAALRGLSFDGVNLARKRELLWFGSSCGFPAWFILDAARVNAQSRRLDGEAFPAFKELSARKAHTLGGSRAGWPVGTREAADVPCVVLTEGGPDLLAAHHFVAAEGRESDVAVVSMLGAGSSIPEDALLILANKCVRIFPHADVAGQKAAVRWTAQLERVGCEVDAFRFDGLRRCDGGVVGDLNDLALIDADSFESERAELLEVLPR